MRILFVLAPIAAALSCGGPAQAQYGRSGDPCSAPAIMPSGNAVTALIGMLGQHSRDEACAAERRAQWDEYNARQKAAHDEAEAAATRAQEQQAEAAHQKDAAAQQQVEVAARTQRQHASAALQARRLRAERLAQAGREEQAVQERRRLAAVTLARAESAPDNHCREPDLARSVIGAWNGLDAMKAAGVKAIDIEHLTTVSFDAQNRAVACHGVFVTNRGWKIIGTATVRKNVAGDPMFVWERDENQDAASLAAPPPATADSPELAHAVHVEQASSAGAAPVLGAPATLSLAAAPR